MSDPTSEAAAQAELNRFREEWLSEVAKNKRPGRGVGVGRFDEIPPRPRESATVVAVAGSSGVRRDDFSEDVEPRAYHDLPDKENALKLGKEGNDQYDRITRSHHPLWSTMSMQLRWVACGDY